MPEVSCFACRPDLGLGVAPNLVLAVKRMGRGWLDFGLGTVPNIDLVALRRNFNN